MIAVDTNILVYGHREDFQWHEHAFSLLKHLAEEGSIPGLSSGPVFTNFWRLPLTLEFSSLPHPYL